MCRQFSVSRITVRRALADLQTQGLVRNEQGVGAFVVGTARAIPTSRKMGFVAELNRAYEETLRLLAQKSDQAYVQGKLAEMVDIVRSDPAVETVVAFTLRAPSRRGEPPAPTWSLSAEEFNALNVLVEQSSSWKSVNVMRASRSMCRVPSHAWSGCWSIGRR